MSELTRCIFDTYMSMRLAEDRNAEVKLDMVDFGPIDNTTTNW